MKGVIYRKYRPSTFADVTNQNHIKITIQNQIANNTTSHAYIFAGPRGVGKTTIARLLAKTLNCENRKSGETEPCNKCSNCLELSAGRAIDVIEVDAASQTGVDNVRENIIESIRFAPAKSKFKVFIIDEVHMLSSSSFNALLKTLEEPPAHAMFILATTEIHKIPQTILSRCQRFDFKRIPTSEIVKRLEGICVQEEVKVELEVLRAIAHLSEGCLRDAESLFGQILALGEKEIGMREASIILPVTNISVVTNIVDAVCRKDSRIVLNELNKFVDQGGSIKNLHNELIDFVRTIMLLALDGPYHDHYDKETMEQIRKMIELIGAQGARKLVDMLLLAKIKAPPDALPQLPLEICFIEYIGVGFTAPTAKKVEVLTPAMTKEPVQVVQKVQAPTVETPQQAVLKESESKVEIVKEAVEVKKAPEDNSESAPSASETGTALPFSLENVQAKWGRCCEAVGKRNVAIPLALLSAKPLRLEGDNLVIGFTTSFHFETINNQKNLNIISEAVNEVMQSSVVCSAFFIENKEEKELQDLANAFGGSIQD
ncbi:hypothetical protein CO173_03615 [Candidatus Uhrbacteria bacterium CG_4_9_14_3_um_filter_41_35]|uniref:DNA polymerase III subunit gamma/tau n=1 Tax=Candidatus Uhrbacteria bacterium CG_4_9_14_3_um_filter_41_35 TaxID=1975034 RepID=A0A2M7XE04_9BACT|nr:MAG: hypothetical protein COV92_02135 [Candidatus Uhrbacteria bacterium CG11_big_fil_rev_8_21_14_0_20_41_9]PJA46101.1 MAG: hypothetical protein CO173_03615 [Candidatus Uhrbacteria bacterium CG_4_9_14_3_um_filter_41_35]